MARFSKHLILLRELFPFTFVVLLWLIQLAQGFLQQDWSQYSLEPRTAPGLLGIITAPLLHEGWEHLLGNSVPLLVLGYLLFNSYKGIAGKVFWLVYLLNGVLLWLFARDAHHLGASGVVYGLASFLFFSGLIRRHPQLAMISFLVVFLYGSMVWGIFPFDPHVSWEAHLYGGLTGLILSIVMRKEGPQQRKYWQDEKEEEENAVMPEQVMTNEESQPVPPEATEENHPPAPTIKIVYRYTENPDNNNKPE